MLNLLLLLEGTLEEGFFFSLIRSSWKETRQKKKRNLENKIKAKQQCKELDSVTVFSGLS